MDVISVYTIRSENSRTTRMDRRSQFGEATCVTNLDPTQLIIPGAHCMLQSHRLLPRVQVGIVKSCRFSVFRRLLIDLGADNDGCTNTGVEPNGKRRRRLFVSASEIANLINANPHVSVGDAVERLWEKNNRRTFSEALARNKLESFTQEE